MFLVRQIEKIYKYRYKNKYIFYIILKQIYIFLKQKIHNRHVSKNNIYYYYYYYF